MMETGKDKREDIGEDGPAAGREKDCFWQMSSCVPGSNAACRECAADDQSVEHPD